MSDSHHALPVLIVDDHPDIRLSLRLLMRAEGIPSVEAESPAGACDIVNRTAVACAILDLNYGADTTSGTEGLDLVARLRHECPDLPLIVMTAWGSIDLAVSAGVPSLLDVLRAVLSELIVEGVTVAEETRLFSPDWSAQLEPLLPTPRREVPHTRFKELVQEAYVVVRTGEVTSYANVILHCGVNFWEDPYKDKAAGQPGTAP